MIEDVKAARCEKRALRTLARELTQEER